MATLVQDNRPSLEKKKCSIEARFLQEISIQGKKKRDAEKKKKKLGNPCVCVCV